MEGVEASSCLQVAIAFILLISAVIYAAVSHFPFFGGQKTPPARVITVTVIPKLSPSAIPTPSAPVLTISGIITKAPDNGASTSIRVNDTTTVYISSATRVLDQNGNTVTLANLAVGQNISVDGLAVTGGIKAQTITMTPPPSPTPY